MNPLAQPLHLCRALVVDGQPTSRSILCGMLRDLGIGQVQSTGKPADALRLLEEQRVDFILCEQRFEHSRQSGHDLVEELRRERLLPWWTVFILVTGEATRAQVSEAAESAIDAYLVKPATTTTVGERIAHARKRKQSLQPIYAAIDANQLEHAALLCLQRFSARGEHWLHAARVGGEVLLRLGKPQQARKFFDAVRTASAVPWGHLGVARAEVEAGVPQQARRTIENLLADNPDCADAYELMGRLDVEQGDFAGALATYRRATALTPRHLARLQRHGTLAWYAGQADEAEQTLARALTLGGDQRAFDLQSLVLLALLQAARGDTIALQRSVKALAHHQRRHPQSRRIGRLHQVAHALERALAGDSAAAADLAAGLAAQRRDEDFDVEAASNLVALLAQLAARTGVASGAARAPAGPRSPAGDGDRDDGGSTGTGGAEHLAWTRELGQRYCVSAAASELLAQAARAHPPFQEVLRDAHREVAGACEQAAARAIDGQVQEAVQGLLVQAGETLNGRIIELAGRLLVAHAAAVDDREQLASHVEQLRHRYCSHGTRLPLAERPREAGALALHF